jgi:hypothetical protein
MRIIDFGIGRLGANEIVGLGLTLRRPEEAGHRDELPKGHQGLLREVNDDGRTVAAKDVLAPGISEIVAGGQRGGAALCSAVLRHARIQPISSSRASAAGK